MDQILQYWPFGTSTLGLVIGGLAAILIVRFLAGLVARLVSFAVVAGAVAYFFFPQYLPMGIGGATASGPKWVLVSSAGAAEGTDIAYSVSSEPKARVRDLPVCDAATVGTVAECGSPGVGVIMGMAASGLPTDISLTGVPTGVCAYKTPATSQPVSEGGTNKVYVCQ